VIRKAVPWLVPLLLGVLIASQWQDIIRYVKIRQMSLGQGRPQVVPAAGNGLPSEFRRQRTRWHG
jgi:hypothetical protein